MATSIHGLGPSRKTDTSESPVTGEDAATSSEDKGRPSEEESGAANTSSLLAALPPPEPYALRVQSLSLVSPAPSIPLPLPMNITIPQGLAKKLGLAKAALPAKELLHGVSFECYPGEVLAIIGGSGSGKTTALNCAASRVGNLYRSGGSVLYEPINATVDHVAASESAKRRSGTPKNIDNIVGYVRQDDFLLPYLSVRETLDFAASLRLPVDLDKNAKRAIVDQTLNELGLADVADVIVGGGGASTSGTFRKGISGGERRRLSIGCILVTLPSVLVLDEPTTGLDATTAYQTLQLLSNLAKRNRTIILSIHQPRSDAFVLFDRLCLLTSGSVVYSGLRWDVLPYFERLGLRPELHTNPLDFLLDISSVDQRNEEDEAITAKQVQGLIDAWRDRGAVPEKANLQPQLTDKPEGQAPGSEQPTILGRMKRPGFFKQAYLLTVRASKNLLRDWGLLAGFAAQAVIIGVVTGITFYLGAGPINPNEVQTFKTIIFQSISAYLYLSVVLFIFLQCKALVVFDREREDGLYSAVPYVLSVAISYLPVNIIFPSMYAIIIYFLCGYRRDDLARNLFITIGNFIMQAIAILGYALLMTSIHRGFAEASLLGNGLAILFILPAGYLIINLPGYISWTRFLSPYYYSFQWQAYTQLHNREFPCVGVTGTDRNQCIGDQVLAGLRFRDYPIRVYPLGLMGFILVVWTLATIILHFYRPGGVKHAKQQISTDKRPAKEETESMITHTITRSGPVTVELKQLQLAVKSPKFSPSRLVAKDIRPGEKVILERLDARFESGEIAAILGPSGSGKTSLLQLLAGRLTKASAFRSKGEILFNGQRASSATRSLVAFVEQHDDHHLPALTVRETLHYAASLRLRDMSTAQKHARAEEILLSLGLKSCSDNLVGGELVKGISGGEKRRLSLAVELLSDPAVLLVDEPTSGLDSYNAKSVMEVLRDIASSGRTVICSIHQPSSDIYASFDNILVLAKGGKIVTFTPRENILDAFQYAGFRCPDYYNPADFVLDTIAIDPRTPEKKQKSQERLAQVMQGTKAFEEARLAEEGDASPLTQTGATALQTADEPEGHEEAVKYTDYPSQAFRIAFPVVLSRSFKNLRRQRDIFVVRIMNPPFLAILFWLFFLRFNYSPESAQSRVGAIQENSAIPFVGMLTAVAIFPKERDAFYHERVSAAKHSTATFLLSYTVQELPMQIVASLLYSVIFVYGFNLQGSFRRFVEFAVGIWGALNFGESVGIIFSAWIRNGGLSISLVSCALTVQAQLSGIMSVSIPHWLQIIAWAAPTKYYSRIQIINEMEGLNFDCDAQSIASGVCIARTGEELLDTFRIEDRNTGKFVGIFIALIVFYRLLAYMALRTRVALL